MDVFNPDNLLFLPEPLVAEYRGDRFDSTLYAMNAFRSRMDDDVLSANVVLDDILDAEVIG